MDTLWWAGVRELGKRADEHRWTRRRKKQTIWQPLLPDVHWSPILNELHKQNGPLGHKKAIKSDQGDSFEGDGMQRAMTHFFIYFRLTKNNTFALNTKTNVGWPHLGLLRLTQLFLWLLRSKGDNFADEVSSTWDGNKSALIGESHTGKLHLVTLTLKAQENLLTWMLCALHSYNHCLCVCQLKFAFQ